MLAYWVLFLIPAIALLSPQRVNPSGRIASWFFVAVFFTIMIGFRHEVGGDWFNYEDHFRWIERMSFVEALEFNDPGYYGLSWLVSRFGGDIYVLNLFCAVAVMMGVIVFARAQPMPWLALLVAVPYLIVVVAMGYTRQSAALGFAMLGLTALGRQQVVKFVVWVLVGALFHKSAVLLLPIAALSASRSRMWTFLWVAATTVLGTMLLLAEESEALWRNYVEAGYESQGGFIRVTMNAIPAVLYLIFRKRFKVREDERRLWFWLSIFSLACVPLVVISSTATDRVALYFIPIQMYVFAHLHRLATTSQGRTTIVIATVGYYAAVQFVWLNFAWHAGSWVPYHFMPF